ncbi:MAG: hypothetical protein ACI8ZM_000098 [Crocinitomix sp.]
MIRILFVFLLFGGTLSGCVMNTHSADRAVMLEHNEAEILAYAGGSLSGGLLFEYNVGIGLGGRIGMSDNFMFGASADLNYNSHKPEWVDNILYGQVSIEQKLSIVKDIFAIKLKEGIFINNFYGTISENPTTGLYAFVSQEPVIPYISPSLLISPEGRKTKKWQLTIGLNSTIGLRSGLNPWTVGGSLLFDYADQKDKFLTGFELGGGIQRLVKDGDVVYLSLGIFFSKFKKVTPRPSLEY